MLGAEVTNSTDWPNTFNELREIDSSLRCSICYEFMRTAMIIPSCSHNYCSLCIRSYISNCKTQCPACNGSVTEQELRNNRALDSIIQHFVSIRSTLLSLLKQSSNTEYQGNKGQSSTLQKSQSTPLKVANQNPARQARRKVLNSLDSDQDEDFEQKDTNSNVKGISSKTPKRRKSRVIESDSDFEADDTDSDSDPGAEFRVRGKNTSFKSFKSRSKRSLNTNKQPDSVKSPPNSGAANFLKAKSPSDPGNTKSPIFPSNSKSTRATGSRVPPDSPFSKARRSSLSSPPPRPVSLSSPPPRQVLLSPSSLAGPSSSQAGDLRTPSRPPGGATPGPNYGRVDCPVCGVGIPEKNVNLHLDMCLSSSEKKEALRSKPKRKPLPKLVYNLLKDGELKKKLLAVGLPTNGDRKTIIKRYHDYALMYNAECDADNPKSAAEIVKEIVKSEQTKAKLTIPSSSKGKLAIQKGASEEDVTQAQKAYAKEHKDHFASIIANMKKRNKTKKDKASRGSTCVVLDDTSEDSYAEPGGVMNESDSGERRVRRNKGRFNRASFGSAFEGLDEIFEDSDAEPDKVRKESDPGAHTPNPTNTTQSTRTVDTKSSDIPQTLGANVTSTTSSMLRVPPAPSLPGLIDMRSVPPAPSLSVPPAPSLPGNMDMLSVNPAPSLPGNMDMLSVPPAPSLPGNMDMLSVPPAPSLPGNKDMRSVPPAPSLPVPPAPSLPGNMEVYDESTDEECAMGLDDTLVLRATGNISVVTVSKDDGLCSSDNSSGMGSPSLLDPPPATQVGVTKPGPSQEEAPTVSPVPAETSSASIKCDTEELQSDVDAQSTGNESMNELEALLTSQRSNASSTGSFFPLSQVAPLSPLSAASSHPSLADFANIDSYEDPTTSSSTLDPGTPTRRSSRRGRGRARGAVRASKRGIADLELSDSDFADTKRSKNVLSENTTECNAVPVRRSARQRVPKK